MAKMWVVETTILAFDLRASRLLRTLLLLCSARAAQQVANPLTGFVADLLHDFTSPGWTGNYSAGMERVLMNARQRFGRPVPRPWMRNLDYSKEAGRAARVALVCSRANCPNTLGDLVRTHELTHRWGLRQVVQEAINGLM